MIHDDVDAGTSITDIYFVDADELLRERMKTEQPFWAKYMCIEGGFSIVAFCRDTAVGILSVKWQELPPPLPPSREGYINDIEVVAEHRRKGIARRLTILAATLVVGCGIAWTVQPTLIIHVLYRTPQDQVRMLVQALHSYQLDYGRYPTREEGLRVLVEGPPKSSGQVRWSGPYIDNKLLKDPWGRPYDYRCPGRNGRPFDISSPGKDGIYGTDDDVYSWELEKLDKIYPSSGVRWQREAGPISDVFALGFWLGAGTLTVLWILAPRLKNKSTTKDNNSGQWGR